MTSVNDKSFLVIDCSIKGVSVGVFRRARKTLALSQRFCHETYASSKFLAQGVLACLREAQIQPSDLAGIVTSHGPGSFTGIKIGISFCQGFVMGLQSPPLSFGMSSFEALHTVRPHLDTILLPATKTHGYVFTRENGKFAHFIVRNIDGEFEIVGEKRRPLSLGVDTKVGLILPWGELSHWAELKGYCIESEDYSELSMDVLQGLAQLGSQNYSELTDGSKENLSKLTPFYLRKSSAEERLDENG